MNRESTERRGKKRGTAIAMLAALAVLVIGALSLNAQPADPNPKQPEKAGMDRKGDPLNRGLMPEWAGHVRLGDPDDKATPEGKFTPAGFGNLVDLKKIPIMGGNAYFSVFENVGIEGDTFGTGMANFDAQFNSGRSYRESYSPRFDRKAKYLYLYQVVNDRGFDPRNRPGKTVKSDIKLAVDQEVDELKKIPDADEIARFALKLIVDPRYITSWGHFTDSSFATQVEQGLDLMGRPVAFKEADNKIRPVSFLPSVLSLQSEPAVAYKHLAVPQSLGKQLSSFHVNKSTVGLEKSSAFADLPKFKATIAWASHNVQAENKPKPATEPTFVQIMYPTAADERVNPELINPVALTDGSIRAIFVVDFRHTDTTTKKLVGLQHGRNSVVFGFTSDVPPAPSRIRIDSPTGVKASENVLLTNFFAEAEAVRPAVGEVSPRGTAVTIAPVAFDDRVAAIAFAQDPASPNPATPSIPAPRAVTQAGGGGGFAGMTGGFSSLGGTTTGGGSGGGFSTPGFSGGLSRGIGSGGGTGGGIGTGGGTGNGDGTGTGSGNGNGTGTGTGTGTGNQTVNVNVLTNFNATLTNQQAQAQAQAQAQQQQQSQNQNQKQNNNNHNNHGHHGHDNHHGQNNHGHVVPAPASLLLGLLGLPGLWFLRRRKNAEATPEAAEVVA